MLEKIKEAAEYIKSKINSSPDFAIILGSGLGDLKNEVQIETILRYEDIPNFPLTTVEGHAGQLVYGTLEGKKVLLLNGRFHYYEGHSMDVVTFPVRVFHMLEIKNLIVSNACGGVNKEFKVADVMVIRDHINLLPDHPLRGRNINALGPRFVDMSEPYNREMIAIADEVATDENLNIKKGVYVALSGPTFETPAEYGMIKAIGGDAVGMSTVPEVIVAKHQSMNCFGISVITDLGGPDISYNVSHAEVLEAAEKAMPTVVTLVKGVVRRYNK